MYPSVLSGLLSFFVAHEGRTHHMYIDRLGYVTTGIGNLIDSPAAAETLPWKNPDGSLASKEQVDTAWHVVDDARSKPKGDEQIGSIAELGGNSSAMQKLTFLRLSDADVDALFFATAKRFEAIVRNYFPDWDALPADAQMLAMSMAWALGPNFPPGWPKFTKAINAGDFKMAGQEATWKNINADRRTANLLLAANAQAVFSAHDDPAALWYPKQHPEAETPPPASGGGGSPSPSGGGSIGTGTLTGAGPLAVGIGFLIAIAAAVYHVLGKR